VSTPVYVSLLKPVICFTCGRADMSVCVDVCVCEERLSFRRDCKGIFYNEISIICSTSVHQMRVHLWTLVLRLHFLSPVCVCVCVCIRSLMNPCQILLAFEQSAGLHLSPSLCLSAR